jgi:hypothetical protein
VVIEDGDQHLCRCSGAVGVVIEAAIVVVVDDAVIGIFRPDRDVLESGWSEITERERGEDVVVEPYNLGAAV